MACADIFLKINLCKYDANCPTPNISKRQVEKSESEYQGRITIEIQREFFSRKQYCHINHYVKIALKGGYRKFILFFHRSRWV